MPRLFLLLTLALSPILAIALAGALWFFSQDLTAERQRLAEARTTLIVEDLRQVIEARLAIGLRLEAADELQARIERLRGEDTRIVSIEIFDAQGIALYHTDRSLVDERIPDTWRAASEASGETSGASSWSLEEFGTVVIGRPLYNAYLQPAGGIALQYTPAVAAGGGDLFNIRGLTSFLLAFAAALALLWLLLSYAYRSTAQDLRAARSSLARSLFKEATEEERAIPTPLPRPATPLAAGAAAFVTEASQDLDRLAEATREIQRIDDEN